MHGKAGGNDDISKLYDVRTLTGVDDEPVPSGDQAQKSLFQKLDNSKLVAALKKLTTKDTKIDITANDLAYILFYLFYCCMYKGKNIYKITGKELLDDTDLFTSIFGGNGGANADTINEVLTALLDK